MFCQRQGNTPSQCVGEEPRITSHNIHRAFNQTLHPTIWTANWSSWTSPFEPPRINNLKTFTRTLKSQSEGLVRLKQCKEGRTYPKYIESKSLRPNGGFGGG